MNNTESKLEKLCIGKRTIYDFRATLGKYISFVCMKSLYVLSLYNVCMKSLYVLSLYNVCMKSLYVLSLYNVFYEICICTFPL